MMAHTVAASIRRDDPDTEHQGNQAHVKDGLPSLDRSRDHALRVSHQFGTKPWLALAMGFIRVRRGKMLSPWHRSTSKAWSSSGPARRPKAPPAPELEIPRRIIDATPSGI